MQPVIEIDGESGFCFGVTTAITKAEQELAGGSPLYCLGDIVHNSDEVERLKAKGLHTITHEGLDHLRQAKVLLRAHGEPPATYATAKANDIIIIDATCPVVLKLQKRIKSKYTEGLGGAENDRVQIVIYGKKGHAEVNGLVGQTDGTAIVVEDLQGLDKVDFDRPVALYSQTTMSIDGFMQLTRGIMDRMQSGVAFEYHDTICRQVANRAAHIQHFASSKDVVLFVAGTKSSNGKVLYDKCLSVNGRTHLVSNQDEVKTEWFEGAATVGICGATSTPRWLMERVRDAVAKSLE